MKNIANLMKQAQAMQGKMAEMQERLEATEVAGQAGAGLVEVVLNGKGEMKRVRIDRTLAAPDDVEVLEDLIVAAHADAKARVEVTMQEEMGRITGGMGLPPGFKMPF